MTQSEVSALPAVAYSELSMREMLIQYFSHIHIAKLKILVPKLSSIICWYHRKHFELIGLDSCAITCGQTVIG